MNTPYMSKHHGSRTHANRYKGCNNLLNRLLFIASLMVFISPISAAYASCRVGEQKVDDVPAVRVTAPARTPRWREFWASGTYLSPPGWAISKFNYRIEGEANHFTWRWLSHGGVYASLEQIRSAYQWGIDSANRAGKYNLAARFRQEMQYALSIANQFQSSHGAIEIRVMRRGAGVLRGSRTVTVRPWVELTCVGTPNQFQQDIQQRL